MHKRGIFLVACDPSVFQVGMRVLVEHKGYLDNGLIITVEETGPYFLPQKLPGARMVRQLGTEDLQRIYENREKVNQQLETICQIAKSHRPEIIIKDAEYSFDQTKLIIFFYLPQGCNIRYDLRETIQALAREFPVRLQMWQIGWKDALAWPKDDRYR
jgi:cell fate regulator YaaT (PSP1 superfamily)